MPVCAICVYYGHALWRIIRTLHRVPQLAARSVGHRDGCCGDESFHAAVSVQANGKTTVMRSSLLHMS